MDRIEPPLDFAPDLADRAAVLYDRAPSPELLALVRGGPLMVLADPLFVAVGGERIRIDPQFRVDDSVVLYVGQTAVLTLARRSNGAIVASAHETYDSQPAARALLRAWAPSELDRFRDSLDAYLAGVAVGARHVHKEGRVQLRWAGRDDSAIGEPPWHPIDREVVLGTDAGARAEPDESPAIVANAIAAVTELARASGWTPPPQRSRANEVDQLAIGRDGRSLVLVELKPRESKEVGYAPLQVFRYVVEWSRALRLRRESLLTSIASVADARVAVGFSASLPTLRPDAELAAAIAFNEPPSAEAIRRIGKVIETLVANDPTGVLATLELWCWSDGQRPRRLDLDRVDEASNGPVA